MTPRRPTIQDVARLAGVAKGTASLVLNGRHAEARISSATVQRVEAAAEQLLYRPSAVGRMLSNRRANSIGVVFQYAQHFSATTAFIPAVMRAVCQACTDHELDLMLHTRASVDLGEEVAALADGRVDGVLVLRDSDDPIIGMLQNQGLPYVLMFCHAESVPACSVDTNNHLGGRMAAEHLLQLGHRRLAVISGNEHSSSSCDRLAGFVGAVCDAGIPGPVATLDSARADQAAIAQLMQGPNRPTALFVWSDDVAFQTIRLLSDLSLRVPEDVSVVGFDGTGACEQSIPRLTSIHQPIDDIVRQAVVTLMNKINGHTVEPTRHLLPPSLEVRDSSTALPSTLS